MVPVIPNLQGFVLVKIEEEVGVSLHVPKKPVNGVAEQGGELVLEV